MDEFQGSSDLPRIREIPLANGNKYNIKRLDPYGFWSISMEKGQTPVKLQGSYTTPGEAEKAVKQYVEDMGRSLKQ